MEKEEEERKLKDQDEKKFPTQSKEVVNEKEDNMLYTCDLLGDLAMKRAKVTFVNFFLQLLRFMKRWSRICAHK